MLKPAASGKGIEPMRFWHPFAVAMISLFSALPASAQDVMSAVHANQWALASELAGQYADPVAAKLVTYYRLLTPGAASAKEIADFMAVNPDWPQQAELAARRDDALAATPDETEAADLCAHIKPAAALALARCAEALADLGHAQAAAEAARAAWAAGIDDPSHQAAFLQRWSGVLREADEEKRFDRLAEHHPDAAARQAARLSGAARRLALIRLALIRDDPSAASALSALSTDEKSDPGLFLDAVRYLRRTGQLDAALALWKSAGALAESKEQTGARRRAFWPERERLARSLLDAGQAEGAYALAAGAHPANGEQAADASFLAGYIALSRLSDPKRAREHFLALARSSRAVITQARAHYWLARAAASMHDPAATRSELTQAAAYPTTFYGQLAALALGEGPEQLNARILALHDPGWQPAQAYAFAAHEVARAAALLVAWGEPRRARVFLADLATLVTDDAERAMVAHLALALGLPDQAVMAARFAGREGVILPDSGWPIAAEVADGAAPRAVVLGLIRQESSFDSGALSPSGARGLMQLLPSTAAGVARELGARVSEVALTTDAQYNTRLGTAYLQKLLERFDDSLPLALAAYNAGPTNVRRWISQYGDPRVKEIDMIDWIERIPFGETRNYVQRVIENIAIYRAKLHEARPYPLTPWRPS